MLARMLDVEGFILVGGASSRMGADKSQLVFDGQTSVDLVAEALRPVTNRVRVVGSHYKDQSSLPNIPDLREQWGPLGGIQAALHACQTEWCVIVACDLLFVTGELFQRLLRLADELDTSVDAIVPVQSDGHPQPLCAIYRRQPCLVAAEQSIENGEHSPRALLDKVETRYVEFSEISDLDSSEHFFFNANTPQNYERAKQIAGSRGRPTGR